jgi:hypothetical protein
MELERHNTFSQVLCLGEFFCHLILSPSCNSDSSELLTRSYAILNTTWILRARESGEPPVTTRREREAVLHEPEYLNLTPCSTLHGTTAISSTKIKLNEAGNQVAS